MKLFNLLRINFLINKHKIYPCFRNCIKGHSTLNFRWDAFDGPLVTSSLWVLSLSLNLLHINPTPGLIKNRSWGSIQRLWSSRVRRVKRQKCKPAMWASVLELWAVLVDRIVTVWRACYSLIRICCPGVFHFTAY